MTVTLLHQRRSLAAERKQLLKQLRYDFVGEEGREDGLGPHPCLTRA